MNLFYFKIYCANVLVLARIRVVNKGGNGRKRKSLERNYLLDCQIAPSNF